MEENRSILIVDDEEETLKGYKEFLTPKEPQITRKSSRKLYGTGNGDGPALERYNLLLAESGEQAIKIVESELKQGRRVAAGFFDVKLGSGMDGLATIHAIKAMDKDIHCVVVTAYHDRTVDEINQLFGEEFKDQWDYLNKPFTLSEIVQKARQMIAAWNNKRKLEAMSQQLIRSERLAVVGQVARGVGHELGNVLMRIVGKVDLALMETELAPVKEHLKVVIKAAERAGIIIRNLQSFSKSQPSFSQESVVIPMEECISLISHELTKSSITLKKDYKEVPHVKIDAGGLAQVFLNLFINATHAMPNGGEITVTIEKSDETELPGGPWVVTRVSDKGTGIPPEVLPKIFEFAFSTKGDRGSGLGLSVSKDIVESHGGQIRVKTEVGKGTEFSIFIPINPKG